MVFVRDSHLKKSTVNRTREQGFTDLSQSIDMLDNNEEGGHDQNEGVPEEGVSPPLPPLSPPVSFSSSTLEHGFLIYSLFLDF